MFSNPALADHTQFLYVEKCFIFTSAKFDDGISHVQEIGAVVQREPQCQEFILYFLKACPRKVGKIPCSNIIFF